MERPWHTVRMAKFPNHSKAWREFIGITQADLIERLARLDPPYHCTIGALSKIENGVNKLSWEWRRRLARAYGAEPEDLEREPVRSSLRTVSQSGPHLRQGETPVPDELRIVMKRLKQKYGKEAVFDAYMDGDREQPPARPTLRRRTS
jgi:transcriptional regulator with XRE-family HTH domain